MRSKPQRNAYHRFTVDRHLCEAAANAAALVDRVDRPDLLVVGALLHDIGKGYPGDHTEVGIELVGRIGHAHGLRRRRHRASCSEMVRHHLLLPDVATRRDLSDDGTIRWVADAVGIARDAAACSTPSPRPTRIATGPAAWSDVEGRAASAMLVSRTAHVLRRRRGRGDRRGELPRPTSSSRRWPSGARHASRASTTGSR